MAWVLVGCGPAGSGLRLDGPAEVQVDALGPIPTAPRVLTTEGDEASGLQWSVEPADVARVEDGEVHALAPGRATVKARQGDTTVEYILIVELASTVRFIRAPVQVAVGSQHTVEASAFRGDARVEAALEYVSSHPDVLSVKPTGEIRALAPGTAWVTAASGSGSAMVEIVVVP